MTPINAHAREPHTSACACARVSMRVLLLLHARVHVNAAYASFPHNTSTLAAADDAGDDAGEEPGETRDDHPGRTHCEYGHLQPLGPAHSLSRVADSYSSTP